MQAAYERQAMRTDERFVFVGNWPTGDLRAESISRDLQPGPHFVDRGDLMPFVGTTCRDGEAGWVGGGGGEEEVSDST